MRRNKHNNKWKRRLKQFRNYVQFVVSVCTNIKRFSILFHSLSKYWIFFRTILQTLSILNIINLISILLFHCFPAFSLNLFVEKKWNKLLKCFGRMLDRIYFNFETILFHNLYVCIMKYLMKYHIFWLNLIINWYVNSTINIITQNRNILLYNNILLSLNIIAILAPRDH